MNERDGLVSDAKLALDELLERLPSAANTQDPQARVDAIGKLQDAGAQHLSTLLTHFLDNTKGTYSARESAWKTLAKYQTALTQALCTSAGAALSAASAVRAMFAIRTLAKLHLVHYSRMPRSIWRVAYKLHSSTEKRGFARSTVHAPCGRQGMTTVEQELLRMLMLQVSAPDMMPPDQIEAGDRIVERLGAEFTLRQPGIADNPFCYDAASEYPPRRAGGREDLPESTRYFGPGMGYDSLEHLVRQLNPDQTQAFVPFGSDLSPLAQSNAVEHVLTFWRTDCPYARPAHSAANGSLLVSHGYSRVWQHLSGTGHGTQELSLVDDSAVVANPPEVWELRGEGGNELGAEVPAASRGWARCGELVGITMGDDLHCLGLIRRLRARPDQGLEADIALMSREPSTRTLREVLETGEDSGFSDAASRQFGMSAVNVIIVADGSDPAKPPNMLLPADHWKAGRAFELQEGDATRYLRTVQAIRHSADFVRAIFEWEPAPGE